MPSRSANSRSDRARPAASSSNHARPRAIALISVGSHLDLSFCNATAGSTSLISTPRRLKATGAISSIGLSLGFSDAGGMTAPPNNELRRTLIMIASSSIATFSMRSRTTLARSAGERLRAAAKRVARSSILLVWSPGTPAVSKRSSNIAGLVSASAKTLITASSISGAASRHRAALGAEPQAVGLSLDPAHAAELTIKGEDATHGLRLGRVDDERALARVVAERHITAHPHALLLRGGDLVADPFSGDLTLELGKR